MRCSGFRKKHALGLDTKDQAPARTWSDDERAEAITLWTNLLTKPQTLPAGRCSKPDRVARDVATPPDVSFEGDDRVGRTVERLSRHAWRCGREADEIKQQDRQSRQDEPTEKDATKPARSRIWTMCAHDLLLLVIAIIGAVRSGTCELVHTAAKLSAMRRLS
jgi:hypothetical protein